MSQGDAKDETDKTKKQNIILSGNIEVPIMEVESQNSSISSFVTGLVIRNQKLTAENAELTRQLQVERAKYSTYFDNISMTQKMSHQLIEDLRNDKDMMTKRIKDLEDENNELKRINEKLLKEIEELKMENKRIKDDLVKKDERITRLETDLTKRDDRITRLENDQMVYKNMMITAQLTSLYSESLVESIIGRKLKRPGEISLYQIIYNESKLLTDKQEKAKNKYLKKIGISGEELLKYLRNFKDDRNSECHDQHEDPELTINQAKNIVYLHIDTKKREKVRPNLKKFADLMLKELKEMRGDKPFYSDVIESFADIPNSQE